MPGCHGDGVWPARWVVLVGLTVAAAAGQRPPAATRRPLADVTRITNHSSFSPYRGVCRPSKTRRLYSHESRLINCLLEKYGRVSQLARPLENSRAHVLVQFGISLVQILDFDEIKQVITTSIWKNYIWEDEVLRWDPAEFGGVKQIRLPSRMLWTPDIVLYNKIDINLGGDDHSRLMSALNVQPSMHAGWSSSVMDSLSRDPEDSRELEGHVSYCHSCTQMGRSPLLGGQHFAAAVSQPDLDLAGEQPQFDLDLDFSADEQVKQHEELVAVYYNGTIKWIPPSIYRSSCEIDMRNFPFDIQTCYFKFGSWTYDQNKVDVRLHQGQNHISLSEFVRSSEWDVLNTSAQRNVRHYAHFESDPYPELEFSITIRRQSTFYIYLLVLPCVLLSTLTLVLFWIPPHRPDRTAVGMSLFSSFFILLLILVQSSPPTSASISLLGIYYCINMVLIALSTILSVVIINVGSMARSGLDLPQCLKGHLGLLTRLFCVRAVTSSCEEFSENGIYLERLVPDPDPDPDPAAVDTSYRTSMLTREKVTDEHNCSKQKPRYRQSSHGRHDDHLWRSRKQTAGRQAALQWFALAAVLDRFFFLLYLVAMALAIAFVFPR